MSGRIWGFFDVTLRYVEQVEQSNDPPWTGREAVHVPVYVMKEASDLY